jgi:2-C-methyl-D-erythritol 4-phosphate cytidylyltransferase
MSYHIKRGILMSVISCSAIILAGGVGARISSTDVPKQYIDICGRPLISYVLDTVISDPVISTVVIVCADEYKDLVSGCCGAAMRDSGRHGVEIKYATPGFNRQMSVLSGLLKLENTVGDGDLVAVIDAARPCMTRQMLDACIEAADEADGAIPVLKMRDTVYMSEDGKHLTDLLERSKVLAGQAPEVFRFGKYLAANKKLTEAQMDHIHGSSEPAIMDGMKIVMIPGDENNYKITTDADLQRFRNDCEWRQEM